MTHAAGRGERPRRELSLLFAEKYPAATARELDRLETAAAAAFLGLAPVRIGGPVLRHMLPVAAAQCLELLGEEAAAGLLREADAQSAAAMLRHLPPARRERLVASLPTASAITFRLVLSYPEDTVGAWISTHALALPAETTVAIALERVRQSMQGRSDLFVVDSAQRPLGIVGLAEALRAPRGATLARVMDRAPEILSARASLSAVRELTDWGGRDALPVVDHGGRFIGAFEAAALHRALQRADTAARARASADDTALVRGAWVLFAGLLQASVALLPARHRPER